ncbi:MAG: TetR/AcrR family transcriptional regulator [Betaproteobacteria bacterium]|nr:TetR/AcrR family transcriptional regulator [Betaproteobacteria bacterium]
MARPRAATYDDQRERILHQAAELFAVQGYGGTSMNEVAQACGVSKAALYHYVRDKSELLTLIALTHVQRLEVLTQDVLHLELPAQQRLERLIVRFVEEYAGSRHEHRVLTEDVKFLGAQKQGQVVAAQRRVVRGFSDLVQQVRPELAEAGLHKAVTMLLFGMINWMFTWLRPGGTITHEQMGTMVSDLFFGGLDAVVAQASPGQPPVPKAPKPSSAVVTKRPAAKKARNPGAC